jgi:polyribonucleotide nucleotidyltransferase
MKTIEFSTEIGGKKLTALFSNLADQTNGSLIIKMGETAVLVTAVMGRTDKGDLDYLPLTVDFEEKFYAAGLLLGGRFIKREGRPSEEAILSGRVVDRTIRPLFDQGIRREIQIVVTVLSIDNENDPDILGIIGASLALHTSDIPWNGPLGAVRVGLSKNKDIIINPTYKERAENILDMVICGKDGKINMIEAEGFEIPEDTIRTVFDAAEKNIQILEAFQKEIREEIGKKKALVSYHSTEENVKLFFNEVLGEEKLKEKLFEHKNTKEIFQGIDKMLTDAIAEKNPSIEKDALFQCVEKHIDSILHKEYLHGKKRVDGRAFDEIRELFVQAGGISDNLHGLGVFFRGGTHVLSVLTLGGPQDSQYIEGMEGSGRKYFMHHYNFPPFSSGEVGRMGGTNRRAVGHGALAEKALKAVIPSPEEFPYTIRLVSESMASNGSTSMGSVCAGSLALLDGGVPIKRPVAGIAMGLVTDGKNYKILTDIQGPEDHHGDMDFKVAGTREGVTAIQMDVKVEGVPSSVLVEALQDAKKARIKILDLIEKEIPSPRKEMKSSAPRVERVFVEEDKIGLVIGPGGKTIRKISEETNTSIEMADGGIAFISGKKEGVAKAKQKIEDLVRVYKEGDQTYGIVTKVFDFGAVVEISPNAEGLVHISELAPFRVQNVTDIVCPGERVPVTIVNVDEKGRLKLSIVRDNPNFAKERGKKDCSEFKNNSEQ